MVHSEGALSSGKKGIKQEEAIWPGCIRVPGFPGVPWSWWGYWLRHIDVTVIAMTVAVLKPEVRHHCRQPGGDSLAFVTESLAAT